MGVRHRELAVEGVQFHPESVLTPDGQRLLANFLATRSARMNQARTRQRSTRCSSAATSPRTRPARS